jgi:hypothetical protein
MNGRAPSAEPTGTAPLDLEPPSFEVRIDDPAYAPRRPRAARGKQLE